MNILTVLTFSFNHGHGTYRTRATQREHVVSCLKVEDEVETFRLITPTGAHTKARVTYGTCLVVWTLDIK